MKQCLFRVGCAALSVSLAAGLFTSCAILPKPTAPVSHPEQDAPKDYDAAALNDGQLRILYNDAETGGNVIFCGDTILRQSPASETSFLLTDAQTGETNYYFCSWADNETASRRRCGLFDKTGKEILTFDREYDAALSGGFLILTTSPGFAYSPVHSHAAGDVRVFEVATGEELPVPENAYSCVAAGDRLAFGIYAPGDATPDEENEDLMEYSAVQVQEKDGTVVYQNPCAVVAAVSSVYGGVAADWIELSRYSSGYEVEETSLLNVVTGEERSGLVRYTGTGTACFRSDDGTYQLVDFVSDSSSTVLREFDQTVINYIPGAVILRDDAGNNSFYDLSTGETKELLDTATGSATLAFYAADGTLRVYDSRTGAVLSENTIEPVENLQRTFLTSEGDGWAWLRQYDNDDYTITTCTVCGPNETVKQMDPVELEEKYKNWLSPLLVNENGIYFSACYEGPNNRYLYDVLDSDGNVVLSGLASCTGYYSTSSNSLPDGVFAARKGFRYGWMKLDGSWVYCQSIFTSTGEDDYDELYEVLL